MNELKEGGNEGKQGFSVGCKLAVLIICVLVPAALAIYYLQGKSEQLTGCFLVYCLVTTHTSLPPLNFENQKRNKGEGDFSPIACPYRL